MNENISPELFDHLVDLAALELSAEEAIYLRTQLNLQLGAIHELAAIPDTQDLQISSHGIPFTVEISPAYTNDTCQPSIYAQKILEQAPKVDSGYILVPDIPHTTLS